MTWVAGQRPMMPPCPKRAGLGGVHWLTCATLRLAVPVTVLLVPEEEPRG